MRKIERKLQVAENKPNLVLDLLSDNRLLLHSMKRKSRKAGELGPGEKKLTFIASPYDQKVIEATLGKHNLRKASEAIRMALKRLAEHDNLELAS